MKIPFVFLAYLELTTFSLSATDTGNVEDVLLNIPGEIRSLPSDAELLFLAAAGHAIEIRLAFGFDGGLGGPNSSGSSFGNFSSRYVLGGGNSPRPLETGRSTGRSVRFP